MILSSNQSFLRDRMKFGIPDQNAILHFFSTHHYKHVNVHMSCAYDAISSLYAGIACVHTYLQNNSSNGCCLDQGSIVGILLKSGWSLIHIVHNNS